MSVEKRVMHLSSRRLCPLGRSQLIYPSLLVIFAMFRISSSQIPDGIPSTLPPGICPEGCNCVTYTGLLVDCNNLEVFPAELPTDTEMLNIEQSYFGEIPSTAFQELHNLRFISIHGSRIGTIRSCAFSALTGLDSISIYDSTIETIENGAFSHIENTKSLAIYKSNITLIKMHSFIGLRNISEFSLYDNNIDDINGRAFSYIEDLDTMSLYKSNINIIRAYAFTNIKDIDDFSIYQSNISTIKSHAFFNISEIRLFSIYGCDVTNFGRFALNQMSKINSIMIYNSLIKTFECGNMDMLKETMQGAYFHSNRLKCDCNLVWLIQMLQSLPPLVGVYSNRCIDPEATSQPLFEALLPSDICSSTVTSTCKSVRRRVYDLPEVCGFVAGGSAPTTPEWYYDDETTEPTTDGYGNTSTEDQRGSSPRMCIPVSLIMTTWLLAMTISRKATI